MPKHKKRIVDMMMIYAYSDSIELTKKKYFRKKKHYFLLSTFLVRVNATLVYDLQLSFYHY